MQYEGPVTLREINTFQEQSCGTVLDSSESEEGMLIKPSVVALEEGGKLRPEFSALFQGDPRQRRESIYLLDECP